MSCNVTILGLLNSRVDCYVINEQTDCNFPL
uniref:Uncharacterized protein n=1 Tax=Arundo donax TaxID=35708 RepID=A0A0A9HHF4_ARUDO